MKRVISLLFLMAICHLCLTAGAQERGNDFEKQARASLSQKDYIRARYLFLQAYNAFAANEQYAQATECGVQAAALYHRENYYNEAFDLLYSVERTIIGGEQKTGKEMPALRYPVTRERLRMYIKLRKTASAKEQLSKLEGWAKAAKVDSLSTNLLYTQANYYYTFGMNAQGDQAFKHLVEQYAQQADYDKAEACYQELIGMSRRSGNTSMMARAYSNYMAWHDSIANIKAQQAYNALKAQYDSSLQTIGEKDDALAARRYTIVGLCILAAILAGALVLGGIVLLRFIALNRKQQKSIRTLNEHLTLKTQFISHISAQMQPTLDTLDANLPAVQALQAFTAHIEELSALEDTLGEPYELEETNVATFCERVADEVRSQVQEGVALTVNAPKLNVRINAEHVSKVLRHLLLNAAKHTPAEGKIWLDFKKRGAHTHQFVVTDTGCGIVEDSRANLFKPFNAVRDLTQGDGLGLPICSLEATKMNGSLTLDPSYNKGARFILELHA
ncbi:HAMP domain-containing histidine kinase [Bacteroides sp. ET71]|uniref:sensor histidine kinase n=1 Tax=Bacteroides sp. ET71 TaxID=2939421 RepID=UPI002013A874|nr:HAMP domain-containing sensor histidine kinase [Bacteroides sp. ET71]MCL1617217.1 HAMP domain-containing histidine kinase [Bacteroides sp. ET71]